MHRILAAVTGQETMEVFLEPVRASRPVFRIYPGEGRPPLVGKFFEHLPPVSPKDRGLLKEYQVYLRAAALGLPRDVIPRLLGRFPPARLGLLLEGVPGQDLDYYLNEAVHKEALEPCLERLQQLAQLLATFHTRPRPSRAVEFGPARGYFHKLLKQLRFQGLLSPEEQTALAAEGRAWEERFQNYRDHQVLLHGDATPTNFLFPNGRAVALDLERLRLGDRLFDLSWVAGELRHAWGWRGRDFAAGEPAVRAFFRSYLEALPGDAALTERMFALNPFYLALAELRIARNAYLSWDYRRALVAEACRCLTYGRRGP